MTPWGAWVGLAAVAIVLTAVDIQRFHRRTDPVSAREAAVWSAVLVTVGLAFAVPTAMVLGVKAAQEYLGGYLIEKALAIENVYAIATVVAAFSIPAAAERRLLAWAIAGAIGLRLAFLALGLAAGDLRGLLPVFGSLLVVGGVAMALGRVPHLAARRNPLVTAARGPVRSTPDYEGAELVVERGGRRLATPLLAAVIAVITVDIVFAASMPIILTQTKSPFLVVASTVFALLGLRGVYFVLTRRGHLDRLKRGVGLILAAVGAEMVSRAVFGLEAKPSLVIVPLVLLATVVDSLRGPAPEGRLSGGAGRSAPRPNETPPAGGGGDDPVAAGSGCGVRPAPGRGSRSPRGRRG
jgi:tellurite resistance protein TerC